MRELDLFCRKAPSLKFTFSTNRSFSLSSAVCHMKMLLEIDTSFYSKEITIRAGQTFVATINFIDKCNDIESKCNHFDGCDLLYTEWKKKPSKHTNNSEQYEQYSQLLNAFEYRLLYDNWYSCQQKRTTDKKVHSTEDFLFLFESKLPFTASIHLPGSCQRYYFDNLSQLFAISGSWFSSMLSHSILNGWCCLWNSSMLICR